MIRLTYHSVDGFRATATYKTLKNARKEAHRRMGEHPEIGRRYAVSGDGVGTLYVEGATLDEIFPPRGEVAQ